jgi:hypothetical protein
MLIGDYRSRRADDWMVEFAARVSAGREISLLRECGAHQAAQRTVARAIAGGGSEQVDEVGAREERIGDGAAALDVERRANLTAGEGEQNLAVQGPGAVERGKALEVGGVG